MSSGVLAATGTTAALAGTTAAADGAALSIRLEDIACATDRVEIARIAGISLHLAPQPGHLHIHVTDVAAELRRLRQLLSRYRLPRFRRKQRQQAALRRGQVHGAVAAKQLAAGEIEPKPAEAQRRFGRLGRGAPF